MLTSLYFFRESILFNIIYVHITITTHIIAIPVYTGMRYDC